MGNPTADQLIKAEQDRLNEKADAQVAKATPIVHDIFFIIASAKPKLDIASKEEFSKEYKEVVSNVLVRLKESGMTVEEIEWTLNRVKDSAEAVASVVGKSVRISVQKATEKAFGKQSEDMTLDDLDKFLVDKS